MTGSTTIRRRCLLSVAGILAATLAAWDARAAGPAARAGGPVTSPTPLQAARTPFTVGLLGDGNADAVAAGLQAVVTDPAFKVVTNLHAGDGTDWVGTLRDMISEQHPGALVVMIGAAPQATDHTGYGDRVTRLAELARARSVPLIWVGLPIVADEALASTHADLNGIARERVVRARGRFVDSWDAFADENGRFDPNGPDKDGRRVALRTSDGQGFTSAGAAKLASFVLPDLRRSRAEAEAAATAVASLPVTPQPNADINAEIRRELGLPALGTPGPALPPSGGVASTPPMRLNAPPVSPGGALVAADIGPPPLAGTAVSPVQRVLVEGRPVAPKPGRIDDFSWPPQ